VPEYYKTSAPVCRSPTVDLRHEGIESAKDERVKAVITPPSPSLLRPLDTCLVMSMRVPITVMPVVSTSIAIAMTVMAVAVAVSVLR
jgi:hypothetical protein